MTRSKRYEGKRVGIVGYGVEGRVSAQYWRRQGAHVTIFDGNDQLEVPTGMSAVVGDNYLDNFDGFDVLVHSPGIRPDRLVTSTHQHQIVTSATAEFFRHCPAPIIGVTGTKGKGTTSTLVTKLLEAAGYKVWLGGNIGQPALEFIDDITAQDKVVLELSSFQLMDLPQSPQTAVCLMMVPEHLDWHTDIEEYIAAKGNITRYQTAQDMVIYHGSNDWSRQVAELSIGHKTTYMKQPGAYTENGEVMMAGQRICGTKDVGLVGAHMLENICAAVTTVWDMVHHDARLIAKVIKDFKGLPMRLEPMERVDGVVYVNDSYSTNQYATMAALTSFEQAPIVILGGFDRGIDLTPMITAVAEYAPRGVVAIGQTATIIRDGLHQRGYDAVVNGGSTMTEIVAAAAKMAQSGDVVILSPGCASFDMFKNFKDRGEQFRRAVAGLPGKHEAV